MKENTGFRRKAAVFLQEQLDGVTHLFTGFDPKQAREELEMLERVQTEAISDSLLGQTLKARKEDLLRREPEE